MRKIASTFAVLLFATCATAQVATDTVKIKLQTTAGAELAIDGDVSSTNIMSTRVPVGKHVVTIRYGSSFERSYDIDVTKNGEISFSFPIGGEVLIDCAPKATVVVDGIPVGVTPQTVNLIGTHNIKLQGDENEYFDLADQLTVDPLENLTRSYTLRKRPPRLYGMVLANYSVCNSFGVTLAMCRKWGGFVRMSISPKYGEGWDDKELSFRYNDSGQYIYPNYKREGTSYVLATAGVMRRLHKCLYAYLGAGYGRSFQRYKAEAENDYPEYVALSGAEGVAGDLGLIFKHKALLVQAGYASILNGKFGEQKWHSEFYVGLGVSLHKKKKSNR